MRVQAEMMAVLLTGFVGLAGPPALAQGVGKYLAPRDQVVATGPASCSTRRAARSPATG